MSEIDDLWELACAGDRQAFGDWMGRVERPIRRGLFPFAKAVDAEGVVQETLMRMWLFACDRGATLTGENASLRWAHGMARNIARNEARKRGHEALLPPEELPEPDVVLDAPADPFLSQAVRECLSKLARKPFEALQARMVAGALRADRVVAEMLGMTKNTFLQNVVRARKQLAECLRGRGIDVEEYIR